MTSTYTYPSKTIYPRPIIVCRQCRKDQPQEEIAAMFGLRVQDFIWISTAPGWPNRIEGNSRRTLVLDPTGVISHPGPNLVIQGFAQGIMRAFDQVICPPNCQTMLEEWAKAKNPPMYRRMVGEDVSDINSEERQETATHQAVI